MRGGGGGGGYLNQAKSNFLSLVGMLVTISSCKMDLCISAMTVTISGKLFCNFQNFNSHPALTAPAH